MSMHRLSPGDRVVWTSRSRRLTVGTVVSAADFAPDSYVVEDRNGARVLRSPDLGYGLARFDETDPLHVVALEHTGTRVPVGR